MALRQICQVDDIALYKKCRAVEVVDDKIRALLQDLADTMYHVKATGLSANQVGILKQLIVVDTGNGLLKLVNPEIIEFSGVQTALERCPSFPEMQTHVRRPAKITVKALNELGEEVIIHASDVLAQNLSHEIDHINGIVFTRRLAR